MYAVECEKVVGDGSPAGVVYTLSTLFPGCSPRVMHRVFHRGEEIFEVRSLRSLKTLKTLKTLATLMTLMRVMGLKAFGKKCERGRRLARKSP